MLFVIDIGNTNTVMGVYDAERLVENWRIRTEKDVTADEFNVMVQGLFAVSSVSLTQIDRTIISSVVPSMVRNLDNFCRRYLKHKPHWVDAKSYPGMPILLSNPAEVGADRIVNGVAAFAKYKTSLIVIDFGTATTFDAISPEGAYLGGAISPGIKLAAEALFQKASKLPRVELFVPPPTVVGTDTATSMQSGIIFGYAGLVDGMVMRMKKEMGTNPRVVATGGLADLMYKVAETIEAVEPALTLAGLKLIHDNMNSA